MRSTTTKSAYFSGFRDGLAFLLVAVPFALLFGVVATEAGLNLIQTLGFSALVIAGAAQFAALQQMADHAPVIVVVATALAVNLRMAMYSAALVPHIGAAPLWKRVLLCYFLFDQNYAVAAERYEANPDQPLSHKLAYFFGVTTPMAPSWIAGTLAGALVGAQIPPEFALDFALPITFLAIIGPALRTAAHMGAAFVSVAAALVFAFLPLNLGLLVAAVLAMMTGAQIEKWQEGRP